MDTTTQASQDTAGPPSRLPRPRPWERLLARCVASSLDARLAAGLAPEGVGLSGARARSLTSRNERVRLSRDWNALLSAARQPPAAGHLRVALCRKRIVVAEPLIRQLLRGLLSPAPPAARGVAIARRLVTDGLGPVYNHRCETDLGAALCDAIRWMDPSARQAAERSGKAAVRCGAVAAT